MSKNSALAEAVAAISKKYGEGAIMLLGEHKNEDVQTISTGSLGLDLATGIGGVPKGRIIEIYGPASAGKTTLALTIVAEAQKKSDVVAYIDTEFSLDPKYAHNLGVDVSNLYLSQPSSGEEALDIVKVLAESGKVGVIVVDSVASLVTTAEINGEFGDANMGGMARLMSQAMRKLTPIVSQNNVCLIFLNQIRDAIGVMFGPTERTTGGRALPFYASMRFDIRRIGAIKDGDKVVGSRTKVKVVKNKLAAPFRECEFEILYGQGISRAAEIFEQAVDTGKLEKRGAWYYQNGDKVAQGRAKVIEAIKAGSLVLG